jgi:AraC-like DNA-binding protein
MSCWRALPHTRHAVQDMSAPRPMPGRFLCLRPAALTTLRGILKRLQVAVAMPIEDIFDSSPRVQTTDVDEATDVLSRVYLPVKLRPVGSNSLDMDLRAQELPMLTAGYLHFGTDVCIRGDDVPAYYIEAPLSGTAVNVWRDGRLEKTTAGSAAVFTPGMPVDLNWSGDCREICIKVTEEQMQWQLETMLNRPVRKRITFARSMSLSARASRDWFGLVGLLAREAGQADGILAHRLAIDNLQHLLVQGLLLIQPHNYAEALAEEEACASTAVVRRAIDLMHAHPETPWGTVHLARATGVSARALQKAFQRSGQPPPMTYLRRLRLHKARAELAAHCPNELTVTAVASHWGFLHLSRFAEQYRQLFGESPSETLKNELTGSAEAPQ